MNIQIPDKLSKMIGEKCYSAKLVLSKGLRLDFGGQFFHYHSKLRCKDIFRGEWSLTSNWSFWRVFKDSKIVCSAYDEEEIIAPSIKSLLNGEVQEIVHTSIYDLTLIFENGIQVEFLGISDKDYPLEIWCPDNVFLEYSADNGWIEKSASSCERLTKEEELLSKHSERFHERWGELIPQCEGLSCIECAYYMPVVGKFYFWDYGLYSNEASPNDGKLVGVKSGCVALSATIK